MAEITMKNGNELNNLDKPAKVKKSKFTIRKPLAQTLRFGEITPFFNMQAVPDDGPISMRSVFDLRTFTLQSPMLQDLVMHKNYFQVPYEAILPFNWKDKIYPNPTLGDDVPSDAYTYGNYSFIIKSFADDENIMVPGLFNTATSDARDWFFSYVFARVILLQNVFSSGSLANTLGYGLPIFDFDLPSMGNLFGSGYSFGVRVYSSSGESIYSYNSKKLSYSSVRSLVNDYIVLFSVGDGSRPWASAVNSAYASLYNILISCSSLIDQYIDTDVFKFDLSKLLAYQILCSHFYSNDKIDFVYNADLWRQNVASIFGIPSEGSCFSYNGVDVPFDWFSYYCLITSAIIPPPSISSFGQLCTHLSYINFWNQIFGYRRSLKFEDYFTGSRPRPLAIGNTITPVTASGVDVVDVTRNIQAQKYLNQVNRVGRKFSNYVNGLFGVVPQPDWHDPKFIAHTQETVYGTETENTGAAQMSEKNNITTNLRCNSNRFEFSVDIDRPSILLGLISFDIVRYYTNALERDTLTKDRFDMFLPQFQFIGDQKVYSCEYDRTKSHENAFGYSTRNIEYKMSFPRAVGGFASGALPSWIFDNQDLDEATQQPHISPMFIRSLPAEFDKFYLNGVGTRMCDYFHFILKVDNIIDAVRPMVVSPQILG